MDDNYDMLVNTIPKEDERSYRYYKNRMGSLAEWLTHAGCDWSAPDLARYRRHLLEERGYAPSTVNSHLSSIRTRYRELLSDGTLEAALKQRLSNPGDVDSAIERIKREIISHKLLLKNARADIKHIRLKAEHICYLLAAPYRHTALGFRDAAAFTFLFTTGIRTSELCALSVEDLYQKHEGQLALHIPFGTGCVERLIPYGSLDWGLDFINEWLEGTGIEEGPVFRGFYRGGERLRPNPLSSRALEYALAAYPVTIDDQQVSVSPMDLRRAHARLLYEAGFEYEVIKARLGISDNNTFMDYIGPRHESLDASPAFDILDRRTWLGQS